MLDETDGRILADLRANARDSYRQIARRLKLHPSTVIKRVEAMRKSGVITGFGAHVDYLKMGYEFMALMAVRCTLGHVPEVGAKFRSHPGVVAVWDITGDGDIMALVACHSRAEFNKLIKHLGALAYVERTNTHVVLDVLKNEWEFKPQ
jgi:DNA-binding Lrp family transcriptional regulator